MPYTAFKWVDWDIATEKEYPMPTLRTDKAKSIYNLSRGYYSPICCNIGLVSKPQMSSVRYPPASMPNFPTFARPCPVKPRHGFVESRIVDSPTDLLNMYVTTLRIEQEAEVVCMPRYTALISAVATNSGVTWGMGNDGVTAGKDTETTFIAAPSNVEYVRRQLHRGAGNSGAASLSFKKCPYFEIVEHKKDAFCVQVREGPALPVESDFIPCTTKIKQVRILSKARFGGLPDLMDWEKICKKLPPDTVVHFPGGNLASHYAIHAIQRGIPVLCGKAKPGVGETIHPTPNTVHAFTQKDRVRFNKWVAYWDRTLTIKECYKLVARDGDGADWTPQSYAYNLKACRYMLATAVATVHASLNWDNRPVYLALRAFAAVTIAKFVTAACVGENRHYYKCGPGHGYVNTDDNGEKHVILSAKATFPWKQFGVEPKTNMRTKVYQEVLGMSLKDMKKLPGYCVEDFSHEGWQKDSSYGGPKWAQCAQHADTLINLMWPHVQPWEEILGELNRTVNAVHNGGRILTKWLQDNQLNILAEAPAMGFINIFAGIVATDWKTMEEKING